MSVINVKDAPPGWACDSHYAFIGRPGRWGNRFRIGRDGSRADVIRKHKESLTPEDKAVIRRELRGKILVCYCKPKACHGDTLVEIANS